MNGGYENAADSGAAWSESDSVKDAAFDGSTTRSTWQKIWSTADRIMGRTLETAEDVMQRGIIGVEVTALRLRLRALYAKIGEIVFRLREAEERSDALEGPEVQELFAQARAMLNEIASHRNRVNELRERAQRDEYAGA